MNGQERREQLKAALQAAGRSWLLEYSGGNADKVLDQFLGELNDFAAEYEKRFGEKPDPLALHHQNQPKSKAFFQSITSVASVEMLILVWRILLGCEILRVHFHYELGKAPDFSVVLRAPDGSEETYKGSEIWDFRILRHFGMVGVRSSTTGMKQGLVLQGFYPSK